MRTGFGQQSVTPVGVVGVVIFKNPSKLMANFVKSTLTAYDGAGSVLGASETPMLGFVRAGETTALAIRINVPNGAPVSEVKATLSVQGYSPNGYVSAVLVGTKARLIPQKESLVLVGEITNGAPSDITEVYVSGVCFGAEHRIVSAGWLLTYSGLEIKSPRGVELDTATSAPSASCRIYEAA